jgi:DNA-binding PadR family transcriptional regulator
MFDHDSRRNFRREFRDFWHDWRNEQRQAKNEFKHGEKDNPDASSHEGPADAWREFFHSFTGNWPEDHWIFGGRRFSPWCQGVDTFNPFVSSLLSKGGGLLPLYVLHLLSQKPRYGNEIMEILSERTGGQWVSNPGAIYPLLALLERKGYIEGKWEDPQKRTVRIYRLTKEGEEELVSLKAIMIPKISETIKILNDLLQDFNTQSNATSNTEPPTTDEK